MSETSTGISRGTGLRKAGRERCVHYSMSICRRLRGGYIFMAIEDLIAVVAPPAQPREAGNLAAWTAVEARLGTRLPTDFRDFVFQYGSGAFNDPGRLCIFPRNPL